MKPRVACCVIALWSLLLPLAADELDCLTESEAATAQFYPMLQQQAYAALDRRDEEFEKLVSPEQIVAHQQRLREFFVQQLGGFPERSPLNAQTMRTIQADGYRIECVIFESQPHHHVTANLYLPDAADGPVPGVVASSGHSRTAKTADYNQRFGIMMARNGMAALCFDPIGQGERSQFLNDAGEPRYSGTTTEHFLVGVGSILTGRSTARYRVWDAMRAIDYLTSRPEVNPNRIGFTGCSGGGTLTSYVMALDDRVACAAPACYLTTFRSLIQTIGPQDAEQNIYGQITYGLDHPDYVLLRAPRPTLISATTGDYFGIAGTWENYRQAKRIYGRLGYPERIDLVETDGNHGVQPQNLATIAQWMQRWLMDRDESIVAVELPTLPPEQLLCTDTGQVLTAFSNEKSVVDLNADFESTLAAARRELWQNQSPDEMRDRIRDLLSMAPGTELPSPEFQDLARVSRDGFHIDKFILKANDRTLPGLTFHPPDPADEAYLYLHDSGKQGDSQADGPISELMNDGHVVVTIDMSGQGETGSHKEDPLLTDWKTYFLSYLLGKPLLGTRVEDVLAAGAFVAGYEKDAGARRKVHLLGTGRSGIIALHAAALQPDLFTSVTVRGTIESWASLVRQTAPAGQLETTVHGALTVYDLPDLIDLIGSDKVTVEK